MLAPGAALHPVPSGQALCKGVVVRASDSSPTECPPSLETWQGNGSTGWRGASLITARAAGLGLGRAVGCLHSQPRGLWLGLGLQICNIGAHPPVWGLRSRAAPLMDCILGQLKCWGDSPPVPPGAWGGGVPGAVRQQLVLTKKETLVSKTPALLRHPFLPYGEYYQGQWWAHSR